MDGWASAERTLPGAPVGLTALLSRHPGVLEAALRAIGPPGSAPVLAALSAGGHALLRAAALENRLGALAAILGAYGSAPDVVAPLLPLLSGEHYVLRTALRYAHLEEAPSAVAALLGVYCAAGKAAEALEADSHYALRLACGYAGNAESVSLLLAEYGEHGGAAALLEALCVGDHAPMARAVASRDAYLVASVAAAYPPGHPALRAALTADGDAATLAILGAPGPISLAPPLLAALGQEPGDGSDGDGGVGGGGVGGGGGKAAVRLMGGVLRRHPARLREFPQDSPLARLAVQAPAAWAALRGVTARMLLSAPARAALALPPLLALKRLPPGVAKPVTAYLRARPWLLFIPAPHRLEGMCSLM
jgi:hypothetical protein